MRILFCSDALVIDGVTSYILNTGTALRRLGHDVAVIGRWAGVRGFQSRYRQEGLKVITCPSIGVGNSYFDFMAKRFRPDIIMTDHRRSFPLAVRLKNITHSPIAAYFLDPIYKTDKPGRDIASLVKFSDVFTAFEPGILAQLHELKASVPIVKMPRPLDVFLEPLELRPKENFNILCFGRLSRYKTPGIFHILDNIEQIQRHIPGFTMTILGGGGWRLFKIKLLAHRINSRLGRKCITVSGTRLNPKPYIRQANIVCASATSAMEAAYSLRPVIAMCSGYFGRIRPGNLDEGVRSYFSERYAEGRFDDLVPDLFGIYDEYEGLEDELKEISRRLGDEFSIKKLAEVFETKIMPGIQWHPEDSA